MPIPPDSIEFLEKTIGEFTLKAREKFMAGQQAHGGLITDRDCEEELLNEIIDSVFYFYALKKQIKDLKKRIEVNQLLIDLLRKENQELKDEIRSKKIIV